MSEPPPEQFEQLRRAAFGRDATQADLNAWAAAATIHEFRQPDPSEPDATATDEPPIDPDRSSDSEGADLTRRDSRVAGTLIAAVACAVLGFSFGWALLYPARTSSLVVFDVPSTSEDRGSYVFDAQNQSQVDAAGGPLQVIGDQRLIYEDAELKVWAGIGAENIGRTDQANWTTAVCMSVQFEDRSATGGCSDLEEFNEIGVSVPSPVDGDTRVFKWGPLGDLAIESPRE